MRIGVTGHSNLTADSEPVVASAIRSVLDGIDRPVLGMTCLARGADRVFARTVLDAGGEIEVVLPAADYRAERVAAHERPGFDALVAAARSIVTMPFAASCRAAYEAANDHVLAHVQRLVAVWDGSPPDGRGGTADAVRRAREAGMDVVVVWPAGAARER
ncbi:hypothetical protein ACQEVB_01760 [Pseudonocardia sp. CA-107938]|uniref:hypothetical protein n=1 Tax=Pseudonocardia sp. CA-107938 TaxID=3240021 RepID=UPI003D940414